MTLAESHSVTSSDQQARTGQDAVPASAERSTTRGFPIDALLATAIGLAVLAIYVLTLAPTTLRSDSGEFHVVPWVLGIAHAPGYPLLTLVGRLAMFLPIGDPAYRINVLDAAAAAAAVACVYLAVVELVARPAPPLPSPAHPGGGRVGGARAGGLAGAAALGLGAIYWQQAVVGGPRPFIFFFTALLLWLTFRWGSRRRTRDLIFLGLAAGLALTHHPNLLLLFPAIAIYLIGSDPRLPLRFKPVGPALLALLAPLLLYLYLPLRSAMNPPLGPLDLTDPRELLIYVTAAHFRDTVFTNCGGSRLVQAQRYLVFLMLQFGPLLPFVAALGGGLTLIWAPLAGLALIYVFASNAVFGICSSLAMPDYIVPSFVVAAVWIGLAVAWPLRWLGRWPLLRLAPVALAVGLVIGLSAYRLTTGLPYQRMVDRTLDAEYGRAGIAQVQTQTRGVVLSDWESVTPIWYAQHVLGINPATKTALVTAAPSSGAWVVEAQKSLEDRPVSLAQRVPSFGDSYRLFPIGSLYDVLEKPPTDRTQNVGLLSEDRAVRLLSYALDRSVAAPGDVIRLTLYQRTDRGRDEAYWPVLRLGSDPAVEYRFDPDLRYPLPSWGDGEVVGEAYEFSLPAWLPPGALPLELAYQVEGQRELVGLGGGRPWARVGSIQVVPPVGPSLTAPPEGLASFGNQFVLRSARLDGASGPVDLATGSSGTRLRAGGTLKLETHWSALRWIDESYTLFVHLVDGERRVVTQQDGLPLGGVYHTYKWVPGQVIADWYRLPLPADLPAGDYWLRVGAYHSVTTRRLPLVNPGGGSDRDVYLWGPIRVE